MPAPLGHRLSPGAAHAPHPRAVATVPPRATDGALPRDLLRELGRWLKHKLVQKILLDRALLLETQQVAARKTIALDQRLARLEVQIQRQTHSYERRIDKLNRELLAAKEENRELLRAKTSAREA